MEGRYEYDVFGTPYEGDLNGGMNLGYTGKPYDVITGMYNYGYRDYSPEVARFTTEDPVRDGANWFAYVNNDPVNWVDPDGELSFVVGAIVGFVASTVTEVGGRMINGQSFTEAIVNTVNDPVALLNIGTSTVMGALTAGVSSVAVSATTSSIRTSAVIGANTMAKEFAATVAINTVSGAIDAGLKDITVKAFTNSPQDLIVTAQEMGKGAAYAFVASTLTQAAIAINTNVSTYTYNGLERSNIHPPQWSGTAGVVGENILPAIIDTTVSLIEKSSKEK
jgi:RHS repeat-associated protein